MDRGFDAWAYLVSAWAVEFLVWSYPFSYGVFLNHYATHEFSHVSSTVLSLVGSTSTGLMYLLSLILLPLMNRYPYHKKNMMYVGLVLCMAGLVGAAFAREAWQLILTQGVIYAVGGSMLYFTVTTYLWEWFSEKKGLVCPCLTNWFVDYPATYVILFHSGVGGVVVPLMVQTLLDRYGSRTTLLALGISFVVIIPAFPFIKSRTPVSQVVGPRQINTQFLKYNPFWILFAANILQGLGTFLPTLYMPTFASDLKLNDGGTIALSLMNGASAPGLVFLGYISDRLDLRASILLSALGSALSVLLIWGFASSLPPLLVFACIYGFLAPSWSALWPRFVFVARGSAAGGEDPGESATLMCIFVAGRGIGNVLSAPIASGLLRPWAATGKTSFPYGVEGYGPLILFTARLERRTLHLSDRR
ncbi:major facilitator superfamily domain-containing protein [Mucidula mucida]|nr:major facilitator superfamily domain-containing protein [Mucidula mucida]